MSRLLARFSQLTQDELEDDLFIVEDNQEMPVSKMTLQEFEAAVQVPLLEILQYPYLLANAKLSELLQDASECDPIGSGLTCGRSQLLGQIISKSF